MSRDRRTTKPMLDVLEVLVRVAREDREVHGYYLMRETQRVGATVYNVLDKLEDMGWINGRFEDRNVDHPGKPARRFYRLTGEAVEQAEALLRDRRRASTASTPNLRLAQFVAVVRGTGGS